MNQIGRALIATLFDRQPLRWKKADDIGITPIKRLCTIATPGPHPLPGGMNRNAFLRGCLVLTQNEPVEHLIIGLGFRKGPTIVLQSLMHWVGTSNSVAVPEGLREHLSNWILEHRDNRAIVFHNHPRSQFDSLFDLLPIASIADRNVMVSQQLQPMVALKSLLQGKQLEWHVGQNGFVREFVAPDVVGILQMLQKRSQARTSVEA